MWTDYYLRAEAQDELEPIIMGIIDSHIVFDVIGEIEGTTGWHVNCRTKGELPEILSNFVIPKPEQPRRIFLGD